MMNTLTAQTGLCKEVAAKLPSLLPDLLLDPAAVPDAARLHMGGLPKRAAAMVDRELEGHRATMQLLEHWDAPEVSPYFSSRMTATAARGAAAAACGRAGASPLLAAREQPEM